MLACRIPNSFCKKSVELGVAFFPGLIYFCSLLYPFASLFSILSHSDFFCEILSFLSSPFFFYLSVFLSLFISFFSSFFLSFFLYFFLLSLFLSLFLPSFSLSFLISLFLSLFLSFSLYFFLLSLFLS